MTAARCSWAAYTLDHQLEVELETELVLHTSGRIGELNQLGFRSYRRSWRCSLSGVLIVGKDNAARVE